MLKNAIVAGCGGFIGTILRYLLQQGAALYLHTHPAVATGCINVMGSFTIGLLYGYFAGGANPALLTFFAAGLCGGFTTFSAFSMENVQLLRSGQSMFALTYILLSVILGIVFCWLGYSMIPKH